MTLPIDDILGRKFHNHKCMEPSTKLTMEDLSDHKKIIGPLLKDEYASYILRQKAMLGCWMRLLKSFSQN